MFGKNDNVEAWDEITIKANNNSQTTLIYNADISLRGALCIFTPFIRS
jgi:hypothetical protein